MRIIWIVAVVCTGVATAEPALPTEEFVRRARQLYATPEYAGLTNTLMRTNGFDYRATSSNDLPATLAAETPTIDHVRWCRVPYLRNMRDLGGWTGLRTGRLYRGGHLHRAPTEDGYSDETAKALKSLGIRTDLDLRGKFECKRRKEAMPDMTGVGLVVQHRPVTAYMRAFTDQRKPFAAALKVCATAENYPIYFHCKAGADRTGTLAFVIEGLCGVSETDLQIDYELTSVSGEFRARNAQYMKSRNGDCFHWMLDTVKSYPGETLADRFAACAQHLWDLTEFDIAVIRREMTRKFGK